jgi:hypothetical protein
VFSTVADAGLRWDPDFPLPAWDKWNLPCARNCVRNTLTRLFMHKQWWISDPDCMMLRDTLAFTLDEIRGMATAKALSAGSFIISDDLQLISAERFRIAQQLLPPARDAAVALDLMERETPELFRMRVRSNYARWLLEDGPCACEFDSSGSSSVCSPMTNTPSVGSPASFSGQWHGVAQAANAALALDIDALNAPRDPRTGFTQATRSVSGGGYVNGPGGGDLLRNSLCGPLSGGTSPHVARKHSVDRGLIFKVLYVSVVCLPNSLNCTDVLAEAAQCALQSDLRLVGSLG